jgi:hypothetical protein
MAENGVGGRAFEWFLRSVVYPDDGFGGSDGSCPTMPSSGSPRAAARRPGADGALFCPGCSAASLRHPRRCPCRVRRTRPRSTPGPTSRGPWSRGSPSTWRGCGPTSRTFVGGAFPFVRFGGGGCPERPVAQVLADALDRARPPARRSAGHETPVAPRFLAIAPTRHLTSTDVPSHAARPCRARARPGRGRRSTLDGGPARRAAPPPEAELITHHEPSPNPWESPVGSIPYAERFPVNAPCPDRGRTHEELSPRCAMAERGGLAVPRGAHQRLDLLRRRGALRLPERGVRSVQPRQRAAARHVPERHQVRGRDHRHDGRHHARRGGAGDDGSVCGVLTSGGTESLMNPMLVYREWGRERGITQPNVVHARHGPPGARQGGALLRHRGAQAPVTDQFVADMPAVAALVDDNTVALVGSAGTYPHGLIDPIEATVGPRGRAGHQPARRRLPRRFILCWAEERRRRRAGVRLPAAGCHLDQRRHAQVRLRPEGLERAAVPHARPAPPAVLHGGRTGRGLYTSPGMSGSRSGGIIAAAWAAMVTLGREGYRRIAADIFRTGSRDRRDRRTQPDLRGARRPDVQRGVQPRAPTRASTSSTSTTTWRLRAGDERSAAHRRRCTSA